MAMHFIEHVREPHRLLLVWQGAESSSRTRHAVAELLRQPDGNVLLRYLLGTPDLQNAEKEDFAGFPAFRKLRQEHSQGVLETLLRRLPPRSRGDYGRYLEQFRLQPHTSISDFALLAYTGAKLPSDGFSVLDPLTDLVAPCELLLEVAGFRHVSKIPLDQIRVGMRVTLAPEPSNPRDPHAVAVLVDGQAIGHIPRQQAPAIGRWLQQQRPMETTHVERVNGTPQRPLVYLFARFGSTGRQPTKTLAGGAHVGALQPA